MADTTTTASLTTVLQRWVVEGQKVSDQDEIPNTFKGLERLVRRLQSAEWVMTTAAPTSGFYFYQAMQQMKSKCRVDLSEMAAKLSGQLLGADGLLHLPTDETTPAEQVSLWNPVMDAVGPIGEPKCNNTQYIEFQTALNNFQTCTSPPKIYNTTTTNTSSSFLNNTTSTKINNHSSDFIHNMGQYCGISSLLANTENCTDALVSDNRTLSTLQDMYQYPDKYCKCSSILRRELPSCVVSVADMIDPTTRASPSNAAAAATTLDQAYQKMRFSLSFFKSTVLCGVDLGCHAMTNWCIRQIHDLERCLAERPDCKTGTNNTPTCEANHIFTIPYPLTQGKLPDVCLNAIDSHHLNNSVIQDFANYVQTCQAREWLEKSKNHPASPSSQRSSNESSWLIRFTCLVGLLVVTTTFLITRRWLRRAQQPSSVKQDFHKNENVELEELRGLQSEHT